MARSTKYDPTDTGVLVSPKMTVPKRESEARMPRAPGSNNGGKYAVILASGLAVGTALGFVLRPEIMPDDRVGALERSAADAQKVATVHKQRADELATKLEAEVSGRADAEKQLQLATKDKAVIDKEAAAAKSKLTSALDNGSGSVSTEGDEIRLQLVDKVLFKTGDDQLTERGKAVLAKVATALKELPDKQIWVQGHTDTTPIVVPPAPKPAPPPKKSGKGAKGAKSAPPPPPPPAPAPRFASNWELSAARALTVVHYLQDTAKLEPTRLAALAFGEYRPVSRSNKAANRRIEIVLYPHRARIDRSR